MPRPPAAEAADPETIIITEDDNGRTIELGPEQRLLLILEGNLSTGYRWHILPGSEATLRTLGQPSYDRLAASVGAGELLKQYFVSNTAGEALLQLVYARSWEKSVPPLKAFSLRVLAAGRYDGSSRAPRGAAQPAQSGAAKEPVEKKAGLASWFSGFKSAARSSSLPAAFNWCDQGGCTAIKDQGSCGSCWAFSTVGTFETVIKVRDKIELDLSEQYLLSCNMEWWSCTGGKFAHDYHWNVHREDEPEAGAVYEADFPYVSGVTACKAPHTHHEKIEGWAFVDETVFVPVPEKIKEAIYIYGPVSATVCTGPLFQDYQGGVFETDESANCPEGTNHAIVLVGWNDADGAWILRNSWGPAWGENGYIRIKYGVSNVGHKTNYVIYKVPPTPTPTATATITPTATSTSTPTAPSNATSTPTPTPSQTPVAQLYLPAALNKK